MKKPLMSVLFLTWVMNSVGQMVQDGDMEAPDLTAWSNYGTPAVKAKVFDAERQSTVLHVASGGVQQVSIPVEAGKSYTLRLKARVASGTLRVSLGIKTSNSDFEGHAYDLGVVNYGAWNSMTRRFTVPEDFTSDFRLVMGNSSGECWMDDVEIVEGQSADLVLDGDMEGTDLGIWWAWGTPVVKEKSLIEPHAGSRAIHFRTVSGTNWIANRSGLQQRYLPVATSRWYRLSFWYRVSAGTLCPRLGNNDSNNDFEFGLGEFPVLANTDGEWRYYERVFKTPDVITGDFRLVLPLISYNYLTKTTNDYSEAEVDDLRIGPFEEKVPLVLDLDIAVTGADGTFQWNMTNGVVYSLEYTTNLTPGAVWRAVRNYGGLRGYDGSCSATVDVTKLLTGYSNFFFRVRAQ